MTQLLSCIETCLIDLSLFARLTREMTRFYLVNFILSLLVLENFGRDLGFGSEESAALQEQAGRKNPSAHHHKSHKNSGSKRGVMKSNGLHRRPASIISRCQSGGLCISSGGCPISRVLNDEIQCMMEHNNYVCCHMDRVQMPVDVFLANHYD